MTNNVAEFEGIKMILKWYLDTGTIEEMNIIGDSQVVIWRMLEKYRRPVTGVCADVANDCRQMQCYLPLGKISFSWQPRLHNDECDAMSTLEIEEAILAARK